jgi:hypothetical protein
MISQNIISMKPELTNITNVQTVMQYAENDVTMKFVGEKSSIQISLQRCVMMKL